MSLLIDILHTLTYLFKVLFCFLHDDFKRDLSIAIRDSTAEAAAKILSLFEKIGSDEGLPAEDKSQYLAQSLVPGSKAARVVESLPMTAANYPKAMELLKERFGREDLLVQIYVRTVGNGHEKCYLW
ncbi:uncharacterized protein CEXT_117991 [Caerostris extrusa]|uniref:Annexin n=1 Tax=Caerostris extrusa TaxID=172846 RepID=A0AAV4XUT8_CAEEX|nr:uncharacterized protein CEXT_117991 [Caerostris extrusa]